ncbi:ABC transporter permease [Geitlerinema sp. PCC 7407]|uniref:PhnE/PtxC family ABC transporter permease n=1 Tax=Geitlerinema sp. PCC 7407 TaxID=1173025 RepID=UPI00029FA257|nr:ABC transporter permease subunit [Geitlerinema sp. PCC 7407]AFY66862.1 binding-protein-dependent transport systems inner membrane component [Geitlerinema sp. PCC 7407]
MSAEFDLSALPRPQRWTLRNLWGAIALVAIGAAIAQTGIFSRDVVNEGGWSLVQEFWAAALRPDLSPEFVAIALDASLKTLGYAVCGTVFSAAIGLVGGVLCSEVWWQSVWPTHPRRAQMIWVALRGALAVPRAIHELIWGLFFVNIFGLDPLVAILAIALPFGAITAKVFSELLDETPRAPLGTLLSSGASPISAFLYSILPQAFPSLLSYGFYRFECSVRSAAVLGVIGAGGLGYQLLLSLKSLRYSQLWTLFIALILLSGAIDAWSAILRRRIGAPSRLDLNVGKLQRRQPRREADWILRASWIGTVGLVIFSFFYVGADFSKLWSPRTQALLADIAATAFPPDFSQAGDLLELSLQTLAMSIVAMSWAGAVAIFLSFWAAQNLLLPGGLFRPEAGDRAAWLRGMAVLVTTRLVLLVSRAIPPPIWALVLLFVLFPGILPGAIALGLYNLGVLGRLMAEVIENLDERPARALHSLGASRGQIIFYSLLPNTLPRFLAYILYRWEVCIRATVIVGLVGAGGLGRRLTEQLSNFDYPGLLSTLLCFMALTFMVDLISASVRRSLR